MMTTFIILALVYILSCMGTFKYMSLAHFHPRGKWFTLEPDILDILIIFYPMVNTIFAIEYLVGEWQLKEYRSKIATKFFKPRE